jgi:hypothetical protein
MVEIMATNIQQSQVGQQPPEEVVETPTFYYSPLRYLLAMLQIAWSAFAHPFSSTVIDLSSGEMRHENKQSEA